MRIERKRQQGLRDFLIESIRLETGLPFMYDAAALVIIYGWLIDYQVHVAGSLVILFFIGYCRVSSFNTLGIPIVDIYASQVATGTAANYLVRCLCGAAGTALINLISLLILGLSRGVGGYLRCIAVGCV